MTFSLRLLQKTKYVGTKFEGDGTFPIYTELGSIFYCLRLLIPTF